MSQSQFVKELPQFVQDWLAAGCPPNVAVYREVAGRLPWTGGSQRYAFLSSLAARAVGDDKNAAAWEN